MSFNIRNYTSGIAVEKTVMLIEKRLAAVGASGIMKLFDGNGRITSLAFQVQLGGKHYAIKVPANAESCYEALWKEYCSSHARPRDATKQTLREQAEKTAWKLVHDWIDVQLSMIILKQAEWLEVFMPYVWDGKQTHYQIEMAKGFKSLPEKT